MRLVSRGNDLKEVTEMRHKRGKGGDEYRVLMQVDRETEKSFPKISRNLCHLGVRQITLKLTLLLPVTASSSSELCGTAETWLWCFRTKPAGDFVPQHSQRANTHLEANREPSSRISNGDHKAWNPSEVTKLHEPRGKKLSSIFLGTAANSSFFGRESYD